MTHFRAEVLICVWIFFPLEWIKSVSPLPLSCWGVQDCFSAYQWTVEGTSFSRMRCTPSSVLWAKAGLAEPSLSEWACFLLFGFLSVVSPCLSPFPTRVHRTAWLGWFFLDFAPTGESCACSHDRPFVQTMEKLAFTFLITGMGCVWVRSPRQTTKNDLNQGNLRNI